MFTEFGGNNSQSYIVTGANIPFANLQFEHCPMAYLILPLINIGESSFALIISSYLMEAVFTY